MGNVFVVRIGERPMNTPRTRLSALLIAFAGLLLAQCAGTGRGGGSFDTLGFPNDDAVITSDVPVHPPNEDDEDLHVVDNWGTTTTDEVKPVLRVQFYATTNLTEAEDMKRRASESLGRPVTIDFETPYYKLKVGPFADEDDAERLVVKLRAMGYESAWVVRDHTDRSDNR